MGNDLSVIQFREQAKIIVHGKPPNNADFWKAIWTAPVPLDCVFSEITPDVIRTMKRKKPINLTVLISQAKDEVVKCTTGEQGVIRCLEILAYIMPIVLEPDEKSQYAEKYLFSLDNRFCSATGQKKFIGDELLCGLLDLLFEPGFTVSEKLAPIDTSKDFIPIGTHIWAPGLGASMLPDTPRGKWAACNGGNRVYERRTSVLKCLLACLCGDLFAAPQQGGGLTDIKKRPESRFLETLLSPNTIMPQANALFFSIVNTILSYDPVGWGLPYNYLFTSNSPEKLVNACIEVLVATLMHSNGAAPAIHTSHPNYFIQIIRKLKKKESFSFLYNGLVRLLEGSILASDSMFPYARHQMQCAEEIILIMFTAMFHNRKFVKHVLIAEDVPQLMMPLLQYMVSNYKEKEKEKSVYACLMIFLILSEDRDFGNVLNMEYSGYIPSLLVPIIKVYTHTLLDILVLTFAHIVSDASLDSLITEGFLTILCNISPIIRDISSFCSERLCSMFIRASKPSFIVKKRTNYKYSVMLLEIISKVIGYGPQSSSNLIYSLVCYKNEFIAFKDLTFKSLTETKDVSISVKKQKSPGDKKQRREELAKARAERKKEEDMEKERKRKELEEKMNDALYGDDDEEEKEDSEDESDIKKSENDSDDDGSNYSDSSDDSTKKIPKKETVSETKVVSVPHKPPSNEEAAFVPTLEWFKKWREYLSFEVIVAALDAIEPRVRSTLTGNASDKNNLIKLISGMNFVGLLPIMGGISLRHYVHTDLVAGWLTQHAWEVVVGIVRPALFGDINSPLLSDKHTYTDNFMFSFKKKIKKITVARTKSSLIAAEVVSSPMASPTTQRRHGQKQQQQEQQQQQQQQQQQEKQQQQQQRPQKEKKFIEDENEESDDKESDKEEEVVVEKKEESENNSNDDDDDDDDSSDSSDNSDGSDGSDDSDSSDK